YTWVALPADEVRWVPSAADEPSKSMPKLGPYRSSAIPGWLCRPSGAFGNLVSGSRGCAALHPWLPTAAPPGLTHTLRAHAAAPREWHSGNGRVADRCPAGPTHAVTSPHASPRPPSLARLGRLLPAARRLLRHRGRPVAAGPGPGPVRPRRLPARA